MKCDRVGKPLSAQQHQRNFPADSLNSLTLSRGLLR